MITFDLGEKFPCSGDPAAVRKNERLMPEGEYQYREQISLNFEFMMKSSGKAHSQ